MRERMKGVRFKQWATYTFAGVSIILFYFFMKNLSQVWSAVGTVNRILRPFTIGLILAYLLCPIYNTTVRRFLKRLKSKFKTERQAVTWARVAGTTAAMVLLFAVIGSVLWLLVPQIVKSVVAFFEVLPGRLEELSKFLSKQLVKNHHPEMAKQVGKLIQAAREYVLDYAEKKLLPGVGSIMAKVSMGLLQTLRTLLDVVIGIIVCVYFLNMKERFAAHLKMFIQGHFSQKHADEIYEFGAYTNKTFGGFINGKIIDSIIIGFICYAAMLLLKLPYPELISTIVGVTNIIPFFGPFIGAIPSAVVICVLDPVKALIFLVWIFILQQFDGNILGPWILGGRVGLGSFWVMFAIIVGGGLFGPVGMILGVPVFSIITYYVGRRTRTLLSRKGMSDQVSDYMNWDNFNYSKKELQAMQQAREAEEEE